MAMMFLTATAGAVSAGAALYSGVVQPGAFTGEVVSLLLAALTSIAVAGASALDG